MKRKHWVLVLIGVFLYLQYRLWFSQNGLLFVWKLEGKIAVQEAKNTQAQLCNELLGKEILYFRHSTEALEERARYELDMIKEGEVFVSIEDDGPVAHRNAEIRLKCDSGS